MPFPPFAQAVSEAATEGRLQGWLEDWAPAAEWGVALGTLALAVATVYVARQTRKEAAAVRRESDLLAEQVRIQGDQFAASERPYIWPFLNQDWLEKMAAAGHAPVLPFRNGGTGPAVNIGGVLWWNQGNTFTELLSGNLAAGDHASIRFAGGVRISKSAFSDAEGFVRYHDLAGVEWLTRFRYELEHDRDIRVVVTAWGKTAELGEPGQPQDAHKARSSPRTPPRH